MFEKQFAIQTCTLNPAIQKVHNANQRVIVTFIHEGLIRHSGAEMPFVSLAAKVSKKYSRQRDCLLDQSRSSLHLSHSRAEDPSQGLMNARSMFYL